MFRQAASGALLALILIISGAAAWAAPFAAVVVDARNGKVLYARNADSRLHPASLTKMMTLYVTFDAIRKGEITLDTKVRVSRNAAGEPPSRLGLKSGQRITLRYLIRAAAVKSANDAATAIAEAVGGSEAAFVRRMNRMAKALGMTRTTFRNAHGLTADGHLSTARDMTLLGRHLFFDFPQYYNLFSRKSATVGGKTIYHTNRRFLSSYKGADGIKTGYTVASGFNLVASARRGEKRIITTVFGGRSVTARNKKVAELMDLGFRRAPRHVAVIRPAPPADPRPKTIRLVAAVVTSPRPHPRPAMGDSDVENEIARNVASAETEPGALASARAASPRPQPRDDGLTVVTRVSTSGGRRWSVNLGAFPTRTEAEKILLRTALRDFTSLDGALRKVAPSAGRYEANFVGLERRMAERACSRLRAHRQDCTVVGPGG